MSDNVYINFESKFIKQFTTSKSYRYSLIVKSTLILVTLCLTIFYNPKFDNITIFWKILMLTLLFSILILCTLLLKYISSIQFDKSKKELTINYFQYFKLKKIRASIKDVKYYSRGIGKENINLYVVLFKNLTFCLSSTSIKNSGLDYNI